MEITDIFSGIDDTQTPDNQNPKTLSQSMVKTWEKATGNSPKGLISYESPQCKYYFHLNYIDGYKTEPTYAQLLGHVFEYKLFGTATLYGEIPELPKLKRGGESQDEKVINEQVNYARQLLDYHKFTFLQGGVHLEKDGILGHIDAIVSINGEPAIMDVKFTETKENDKYMGWADMNKIDLLQPSTYVKLYHDIYGKYPKFYYLIVGKTWARIVNVILTMADIIDAEERFAKVREDLKTTDFKPSPEWKNCKSCKLSHVCQYAVQLPEIEVYRSATRYAL